MIPTSLLGRVKVGGDVNAFSFSLYFLLITTFLICRTLTEISSLPISNNPPKRIKVRELVACTLLFLLLVTSIPNFNSSRNLFQQVLGLANNRKQLEFEYLDRHPSTIYFPWNPLAELISDGKLYHFSYGLYDRELAGFPISQKHFESYIPKNLKGVGVSSEDYTKQNYLKEYSKQITVPEIEDFLIFSKESTGSK